MALMKCHECGGDVSSEAKTCPKCGVVPRSKSNKLQTVFGVLFAVAMIGYLFGGGVEKHVAADVLKQYEISKKNGNTIETCVHAGIVAAAYLQAKDEANHKVWLQTQAADCKKAGVPM